MVWSASDIIIGVAVVAAVGALYWLINDSRRKGVRVCGKACGGCPHPCHTDGTPKTEDELFKP